MIHNPFITFSIIYISILRKIQTCGIAEKELLCWQGPARETLEAMWQVGLARVAWNGSGSPWMMLQQRITRTSGMPMAQLVMVPSWELPSVHGELRERLMFSWRLGQDHTAAMTPIISSRVPCHSYVPNHPQPTRHIKAYDGIWWQMLWGISMYTRVGTMLMVGVWVSCPPHVLLTVGYHQPAGTGGESHRCRRCGQEFQKAGHHRMKTFTHCLNWLQSQTWRQREFAKWRKHSQRNLVQIWVLQLMLTYWWSSVGRIVCPFCSCILAHFLFELDCMCFTLSSLSLGTVLPLSWCLWSSILLTETGFVCLFARPIIDITVYTYKWSCGMWRR